MNLVNENYQGVESYDIQGGINYSMNDYDYYEFQVNKSGTFYVFGEWTMGAGLENDWPEDLSLSLFDNSGVQIASSDLFDDGH